MKGNREVYIDALEGRLYHGVKQFRVRLATIEQPVQWYWWYGLSETAYQRHLAELSEKGFHKPIYLQKFNDVDGQPIYQVVFRKQVH